MGAASSGAVNLDILGPRRTLAILAMVAFVCFAPAFWWGAPHATSPERTQGWGVDDETPLGTLGQVHNIVSPRPGRNVGYPKMHPLLSTAAMTPYLAWARMTGGMPTFEVEYPYGFENPVVALRRLSQAAHFLAVLLGVGVVLAAFDVGRVFWSTREGVVGAMASLVVFPMFYYSRTGNVDVPVLFFIALALAAFARTARRGVTTSRAAWLGLWIGLAMATKESAFGVLAPIPLLVAWIAVRDRPTMLSQGWSRPLLAGCGALVVSYGLGSGLVLDTAWYLDHLRFMFGHVAPDSAAFAPVIASYPRTLSGHYGYLVSQVGHLMAALNPGVFLLALLGLGLAFRDRAARWLIIALVGHLLFMFLLVRETQLRYVLPATLILAILAGRALMLGWEAPRTWHRWMVVSFAAAGLGIGLLRGWDLTYRMLNDTRYEAGAWLSERAVSGDVVGFFGPRQKLPPLPEGVRAEHSAPYRGMYAPQSVDADKVGEILATWEQTRPRFIIVMPDHASYSGSPHNFTLPPELFADLESGSRGYRPAVRFPGGSPIPWLSTPELDYPSVDPPIRIYERID